MAEEKKEKIDMQEIVATLQRVQAEFENYKKRVERDKKKVVDYSKEQIILKLLPILDNFELAMQNADNTEFAKGVELIYDDLMEALQKEGLIKIDANGKFDPHFHEALMTEDGPKDNMVLDEIQKGYKLKEKVIRHAKVKISKKKEVKDDKRKNTAKKDD
jgi:molecular chaperone GrpE